VTLGKNKGQNQTKDPARVIWLLAKVKAILQRIFSFVRKSLSINFTVQQQ